MARIAGINIPQNKVVSIALTYIHGIGLFSSKKISHVGTVTDSINVPMIEKGKAMVTHIDGEEVHAMNMKDHSMMILPVDPDIDVASGQEILWMEALGRYKIER